MDQPGPLVDLDVLRTFREAVVPYEGTWSCWGAFQELTIEARIFADTHANPGLPALSTEGAAIHTRLGDLHTVAQKVSWLVSCRDEGHLHPMVYMQFVSIDIGSFLLSTQSLLDHLVRATAAVCDVPGRARKDWRQFRAFVAEASAAERTAIGDRFCDVVDAAGWSVTLRLLRNQLVHDFTTTLVFPHDDTIGFQVYGAAGQLIKDPSLMATDHVVRFDVLAAATVSQLHVLLEVWATEKLESLDFQVEPTTGHSTHPGLGVLANWSDRLLCRRGPTPTVGWCP
jgi:hypothetical protein